MFLWLYDSWKSIRERSFGILCTCANRNLVTLKTPARFSFFEERKSQKERTARGRTAAFPKRKCYAWSSPFEPPLLSLWNRFFTLQREKQALTCENTVFSVNFIWRWNRKEEFQGSDRFAVTARKPCVRFSDFLSENQAVSSFGNFLCADSAKRILPVSFLYRKKCEKSSTLPRVK